MPACVSVSTLRLMNVTRTLPLLALLALACALPSGAPAASLGHASLVIRHQLRGCHAWSLNGGTYRPSQTAEIRAGGWISVTNNDVMAHKLVKVAGPAVSYTRLSAGMAGRAMGMSGRFPPAMLARMGASVRVTFTKPGVYRFTTKPGEDFMPGMQTAGADNVLRLTVRVG